MGAIAAAVNRPPAFSTLVATAPSARKIGLSNMIRVSSIVRSSWAGPNPGVISGTMTGAKMNSPTPSTMSPIEHEVDHGRYDPPGPLRFVGREQGGHDRDQRGRQRPGRHELEDEVGQAECGEERVQRRGGPEPVGDHQHADIAQDPRDQEGPRDDEPGSRERPRTAHRPGSRRARGWASRYAARSRVGETWV